MRWLIALVVLALTLTSSAPSASSRVAFELPYDLVVARNGTIFVTDRSRILSVQSGSGRVRVHRRVPGASELTGLARLADGTLVAADLPSGRILRIPPQGPVATVATVPMPVDLLADPAGNALWVASIADGVGLVRIDLETGTAAPFARVDRPHGLDRLPDGDLVVHDGHSVSRVDPATGAVTRLASVDAFKLVGRTGWDRVRRHRRAARRTRRANLARRWGQSRGGDGPARSTSGRKRASSTPVAERTRARARRGSACRADRARPRPSPRESPTRHDRDDRARPLGAGSPLRW